MRLFPALTVGWCLGVLHPTAVKQQELEDNFNSGRWNENIVYLNDLIGKASADGNFRAVAEMTVLKARQFWAKTSHQNFPPDSAFSLLNEAGLLSERFNYRKVRSDVLQLSGQLLYREAFESGNFLEARFRFHEALALRKLLNDPQRISQSLFYVGLTFEQSDLPDSAEIFYTEVYELAKLHNLKIEQSDAARHMGGISQSSNRPVDARNFFEESLQSRREACYFIGIPYALITLADFISKEDPAKATPPYQEAVLLAEQNNVWRAHVNALNALGELTMNDCGKAIPLFSKAHQLAAAFNYKTGERRANAGLLNCKE